MTFSLFKKQPNVMVSAKKLNSALDFFMNTVKWTYVDVCRNTFCLLFRLEEKVTPRWHVLQILLSKDLISSNVTSQALRQAEDVFLKKLVIKHECILS
ncbi:hypothetical protein FRX31_015567 [Thalictrum thalictroides]|uniref:Uncharacterized protein n=1 Tax=Thalictrum thalictroides TaxID=46969 RepID=A0A7J6WBN2_THATH|nr:hypothetical protein FRX31_015567 [Thalictrum thalictroides]